MSVREKLKSLGLELPVAAKPLAAAIFFNLYSNLPSPTKTNFALGISFLTLIKAAINLSGPLRFTSLPTLTITGSFLMPYFFRSAFDLAAGLNFFVSIPGAICTIFGFFPSELLIADFVYGPR